MTTKPSLLGSTGSIGQQTLQVLESLDLRPAALTACNNTKLLEQQARKFLPDLVCVSNIASGKALKIALADTPITVLYGEESILEAASFDKADGVLNAISGVSGLRPSLAALDNGKKLLLANKESLVCGGELVMSAARREIIPVDSEHSAIFQCLLAGRREDVSGVTLTASGGAFLGKTRGELASVTPKDALKHPTWNMGAKITVDSATLLNKGLELIEAMHLFNIPPENISVIIHPQSIIHSLVEYNDGASVALLASPDMRQPIQYAVTHPARENLGIPRLKLAKLGKLSFIEPDRETFRCLALAERAAKMGGNMGAVLCGAGEAAVDEFLAGRCKFLEIAERVEYALENTPYIKNPSVDDIIETLNNCR